MSRRFFFPPIFHATPIVPPAVPSGLTPVQHALYREGVVKALAAITVAGGVPSVADNLNVTGVADGGAGTFTLTFDRDFANTTYVCAGGADNSVGNEEYVTNFNRAAGTLAYSVRNSAAGLVDVTHFLMMIGDQ